MASHICVIQTVILVTVKELMKLTNIISQLNFNTVIHPPIFHKLDHSQRKDLQPFALHFLEKQSEGDQERWGRVSAEFLGERHTWFRECQPWLQAKRFSLEGSEWSSWNSSYSLYLNSWICLMNQYLLEFLWWLRLNLFKVDLKNYYRVQTQGLRCLLLVLCAIWSMFEDQFDC